METNGRSVSTSLIFHVIYPIWNEPFSLHGGDCVWITFLLLTWIRGSNIWKMQYCNQQMSAVGSSGILGVSYNLFWSIRKYLVLQKGKLLHPKKGKVSHCKGARDAQSSVLRQIWICIFCCTSIRLLTIQSFDISWHISIGIIILEEGCKWSSVFSNAHGITSFF